jgi:hypothetical protein
MNKFTCLIDFIFWVIFGNWVIFFMAAEDNFKKMRDLVLHSYSGGMVVNYSHLAHAVGSSFEKKIRPLGSASRAVFRLKINDC